MLNLDELPYASISVPSSLGMLYLYDLRMSDYETLEKTDKLDPIDQVRSLLINIASFEHAKRQKDSRKALSQEDVDRFSTGEIEEIAAAYFSFIHKNAELAKNVPFQFTREEGECPSTYLIRYLKAANSAQIQRMVETRNKIFESVGSFSKMRESSSSLQKTLSDFEKFKDTNHPAEIINEISFISPTEHLVRQARERKEELELVRRTADMTAKSAKTLNELAIAASELLEGLDERDKRSDRTTRIQLWIAVFSVILSTIFAFASLIFSGMAYYQDKENNIAADKWQSELLLQSQENNRRQKDIEINNKNIQLSIEDLKRDLRLSAQNPKSTKKNQ